ncbi:MAG: hypothetical protein LC747_08765 [Acidobacteria bacterium]|nr:hypothetical protein [Acidobacteriota bacterium]
MELDTHLELALRFEYLSLKEHALVQERLQEVGRIMNGLMRSLTSDL